MPKSFALWLIAACALFAASGTALGAIKALSADINPQANCTSNANIDVSWTGAGSHFEYGLVTDLQGNTIGEFGPVDNGNNNDNFNGTYANSFTTAQHANSLIGSYAWVG